jgi:hypothetical protein
MLSAARVKAAKPKEKAYKLSDERGLYLIVTPRRGLELVVLMTLAVGSTLALIVLDATPLDTDFGFALMSLPSLLVIWVVVGMRSLVLCIRFARDGSWKRTFALGFLLAVAILVGLNFFPFVRGCNYLGGALRFAANRSYYDQQVALLPADDKPRLAIFNWGGMIWSSRGLVYDESDEVALPPGQQSVAWKDNPHIGELSCGNWDARHLWSHFYIVGFPC